jgi:hypothetical protein
MTPAMAGMPASMTGWDVDTKLCQDDSSPPVGIGFGLAVSQGNDSDRAAILGVPSGKAFVGITRARQDQPNLSTVFTDKYFDGENMGVHVRGDIWVVAEGVVTVGEAVYVNTTTGALGHSGGTVINDARWMTSALAGGFAVVRLGVATGNSDAG